MNIAKCQKDKKAKGVQEFDKYFAYTKKTSEK